MSNTLRYPIVTTILAGIALFAASRLFAVGSSASGGGSSFTRDPEEEARIAYEKGRAFVEQEQYSKAAIKQYEKALEINPDFKEAHEYIGEAYLGIGDRESAWKHYGILKELEGEEAGELLEKIEEYDVKVSKL